MSAVLNGIKQRRDALKQELDIIKGLAKNAFMAAPPMPGAPPMDPAMMQGMPPGMDPSMMQGMDPSMMQQAPPPGGVPPGMDPSMMQGPPPGMDPAMMQGMPPGMDPSMMQGPPPGMDPNAQPPEAVTPEIMNALIEQLDTIANKLQQQDEINNQLKEAYDELAEGFNELQQRFAQMSQPQ